jgi:hypothetical protein
MSNSNLPTEFIKILKKEIPSNIYKNVINNLPEEISKNKKLAKSIKKIEETFKLTENFKSDPDSEQESKSESESNSEKIDDVEEPIPTKKSKSVPKKEHRKKSPKIIPVEVPITNDSILKLPTPEPKSKLSFTSLYTPDKNVKKSPIIPWDGKPPVPRGMPTTASDPISVKMKIGDSTTGVSLDYEMRKPIVKTSLPKTDSFNRNSNDKEKIKPKKKTDEEKEAEIKKKAEEEVKAMKKAKEDAIRKEIDLAKAEAKGRAAGKAEAEKAIKAQKEEEEKEENEDKNENDEVNTTKKTKTKTKTKTKQIFNGKSLPAAVPVLTQVPVPVKVDKLKDTSEIGSVISSILDKPLNTLSVGNVLQNMSGMASLLPSSIYSLTIQQLVNYSLKAFGDFFVDISQNITNLSLAKIYELLLKENRILYIGIGLFMITAIMYIFNNFIRIPFSFAGLFGVSGDKRVFINNY